MKIREFKDKNYKAIHLNGKTLRIALDSTKPILDLDYPEFMDVKITDKCAGMCKFCYQNSLPDGDDYGDVVSKIRKYFKDMTPNQKPFQVALGGGNPNQHKQFIEVLKVFKDELDILPNYTTNGMGMTDEILDATKEYCGGVALSCHEHLDKYWKESFWKLKNLGVQTNLHIIISDKKSIDRFIDIANEFTADYFVLLPLIAQGRCKESTIDYEYLMERITEIDIKRVAFGAMFYPYIKTDSRLNISLYEPEIMSKYLDLKGDGYLYPSSFSNTILKEGFFKS